MQPRHSFLPVALMWILISSCSSGPAPPAKGTPAFYWQAASETFPQMDYLKTSDHLGQIIRTDNEFTVRARVWQLVLTAGLTDGYHELVKQFEYGARARKQDPTEFRRLRGTSLSPAIVRAQQFAETFERFEKSKPGVEIELAFGFPAGSAAEPPQFAKAGQGMIMTPTEIDEMQKNSLLRGVVLAAARAVGATNDVAKARDLIKPGAKIPRDVFLIGMAGFLYEFADLFGPLKQDVPDKQKFFLTHAQEALAGIPDSKELKDLKKKIDEAMKKVRQ